MDNLVVFSVVTKTLVEEESDIYNTCILTANHLPTKDKRDELIETINIATELFCDDIVKVFYNGHLLWDVRPEEEYTTYWEKRNKL